MKRTKRMFYPRLIKNDDHPASAASTPAPSGEPVRLFDIAWLDAGGRRRHRRISAPGLPLFEEAVSGFAEGTLIETSAGPVAVEDLVPGAQLRRPDGGTARLLWKGSSGFEAASGIRTYRVAPGSLGPARPVRELVLGAGARLPGHAPVARGGGRSDIVLVPVPMLADDRHVVETVPDTPVRLFHLACAQHEIIMTGGLEVESYHPGPCTALVLDDRLTHAFETLFPHLGTLRDFGPLRWSRLGGADLAETG